MSVTGGIFFGAPETDEERLERMERERAERQRILEQIKRLTGGEDGTP